MVSISSISLKTSSTLSKQTLFSHTYRFNVQIAKFIRPVILGLILSASHARTFSLINGYSAPLEIYKLLEHHDDVGTGHDSLLVRCSISYSSLFTARSLYILRLLIVLVSRHDCLIILCLWIAGKILCVGSEWHRFPSSFFVPYYIGEVRWIDDGFSGLLPFPFNSTLGGTAAAPHYFNNKNKASDKQYVNYCLLFP